MSESKSWDVRPNKPAAKKLAVAQAASVRARTVATRSAKPLRARRRAARARLAVFLFVFAVMLVGGILWCLWQPWLRIESVQAQGPYADTVPAIAGAASAGAWYGIVPKDSLLFTPEEPIRAALLAAHPDLTAVSITRYGMHGLSVTTIARISAFLWCGDVKPLDADSRCYVADAQGLVYAYVPTTPDEIQAMASSSPQIVFPEAAAGLNLYGALVEASTTDPIGAHVAGADAIPSALQFARAMQNLGAPVTSIQLRGDEADLYLSSGTRLTYVLGHEDQAESLAKATFPQLNLKDGSVDYVDLRFDGKVYYKKNPGNAE